MGGWFRQHLAMWWLMDFFVMHGLDLIQSFKNYYTSDNFNIADAIMVFGKRAKDIWSDSNLFDKKKIFVNNIKYF